MHKFLCWNCGKEIKNSTDAYVSDDDYKKLRMGDQSAVTFCSFECHEYYNIFEVKQN